MSPRVQSNAVGATTPFNRIKGWLKIDQAKKHLGKWVVVESSDKTTGNVVTKGKLDKIHDSGVDITNNHSGSTNCTAHIPFEAIDEISLQEEGEMECNI